MARAKLSKVQLDSHFFSKGSIRAIRARFGPLGILAFIAVLCDLGDATDGELEREAVLDTITTETEGDVVAEDFLAFCLEREYLSVGRKEWLITNTRIVADQESLARKQDEWRKRQRRWRESRVTEVETKTYVTRDKEETKEGVTRDKRVTREDLNTEDLKIFLEKLSAVGLDTPDVRNGLSLWGRKCRENGRPITETQFDAYCARYARRPADFARALVYSAGLSKCLNLVDPGPFKRAVDKSGDKSSSEPSKPSTIEAERLIAQATAPDDLPDPVRKVAVAVGWATLTSPDALNRTLALSKFRQLYGRAG